MTEQLTSVRFSRETIEVLKELAELNDGSVAAEIRKAVDAYIAKVTSATDIADPKQSGPRSRGKAGAAGAAAPTGKAKAARKPDSVMAPKQPHGPLW